MVDVLLAHSYYLQYDPKQLRKMQPYPPLGTLYAAAILRDAGYSVALFDAMFADGEDDFGIALNSHRPRYVVLYEDSFHFLVKMCLGRMREASLRMTAMAKEAGAIAIVAGPDVTDRAEIYLRSGADFALLGEADHTVRELLQTLDSGADWRGVAGVAALESGTVARSSPRQPERCPDRFPLPAWDLADMEAYRSRWLAAHGCFSLNMVSTRGCPYHCNWCAKSIWGQQYAMRSPAHVAEEMAHLKRTYQPDRIWFADDIFGLRPAWTEEFAEEVDERDASIPFMIQTRVDRMTEAAVQALARAGCREVWLGAESGSQKVLDAMQKGTRVEEIGTVRRRLQQAGMRVGFFLQVGYPGETWDDIQLTIDMVRDSMPDEIGVSVSYPLPGTSFHDRVREQIGEKTQWEDSGDLAMMFRGTYGSAFYRALHGALHRDLSVRHRMLKLTGPPDASLLADLADLDRAWFELGRLEATDRNESPSTLADVDGGCAAPDLSKSWN